MTTAKKAAAAPKKTAASAATSDATTDETPTTPTTDEAGTPEPTPADAAPLSAPTDTSDGDGTGDETADPEDTGSTEAHSGSVERGPMTGVAATPETGARPPATIVNESPDAAPLSPPADHHLQREPASGHPTSSTDQTYAEVGGQTIAGENHVGLVNRAGERVDIDSLFQDPGGRHTHVVCTERVYELFTYPGTRRAEKRLIFPKGALVPRAQAARIQAAAHVDAQASASASE